MNWKETLTIIGTLTAIFGFVFYNFQASMNLRFDSIDSDIKGIRTDIKEIRIDIRTLSDEIKADRRAVSQRIDFLYQSKADKKSK